MEVNSLRSWELNWTIVLGPCCIVLRKAHLPRPQSRLTAKACKNFLFNFILITPNN